MTSLQYYNYTLISSQRVLDRLVARIRHYNHELRLVMPYHNGCLLIPNKYIYKGYAKRIDKLTKTIDDISAGRNVNRSTAQLFSRNWRAFPAIDRRLTIKVNCQHRLSQTTLKTIVDKYNTTNSGNWIKSYYNNDIDASITVISEDNY